MRVPVGKNIFYSLTIGDQKLDLTNKSPRDITEQKSQEGRFGLNLFILSPFNIE